jgi:gas vesicle protein
MNSSNSSTTTVLLSVLGGAILGAGIALLYAPQSGRRTRQKLRDLSEDAEDYARGMLEKAEQGVEQAKQKGEEWMHKGQDFVEEKKRQMVESTDGVKSTR